MATGLDQSLRQCHQGVDAISFWISAECLRIMEGNACGAAQPQQPWLPSSQRCQWAQPHAQPACDLRGSGRWNASHRSDRADELTSKKQPTTKEDGAHRSMTPDGDPYHGYPHSIFGPELVWQMCAKCSAIAHSTSAQSLYEARAQSPD